MLDKFLFGNKQIPEMYFGNIPVVKIYFGNTLIWEKEGEYVPYDDTCTATITLNQDKTAWIVTITKNGEDVTSSLSQMVTYVYNGKGERVRPYYAYSNTIDLSQFTRGDYRLDLADIASKSGGDFPSRGSISAPEHIYIGNLTAGDICVAIEYVPTNDITVDSLEIFSHETTSYTTSRIKIIHESGLYVGAFNGNGQDSIETRYSLEGRARTLSNVGTTLYKDEKYYIIFQDQLTDKWNTGNIVFKPAYFANEEGNYKANVYDKTDAGSLHPYSNVKNIKAFLPSTGSSVTETDLQSILKLDTDELFLWNGNNISVGQTVIIHDDHLGKKLTAEVTNPPITTSDSDIWSYDKDQIFIRHNYDSDVTKNIWKKTKITSYDGTFVITSGSGDVSCAQVLLALKNGTGSYSKILTQTSAQHDLWYSYIGSNISIKSGYKVGLTNMTPLTTVPQNPDDKTFYYFASSIASSTVGIYHDCLVLYENNSWHGINPYGKDEFMPYLNIETLDSAIEQISLTTLIQEDQQVSCNTDVKDATVSSGRKYYLRINGKEV